MHGDTAQQRLQPMGQPLMSYATLVCQPSHQFVCRGDLSSSEGGDDYKQLQC